METKNAIMMRLLDYLIEVYETNENLSIDEILSDALKKNPLFNELSSEETVELKRLFMYRVRNTEEMELAREFNEYREERISECEFEPRMYHNADVILPSVEAPRMMRRPRKKYVEAFVNNISVPKSLEELSEFFMDGNDAQILVRDVNDTGTTCWTVPRWAKLGDIVLFMHAKTANSTLTRLRTEVRSLYPPTSAKAIQFEQVIGEQLAFHKQYGGKIFAVGRVNGKPEKEEVSPIQHFKSNVFCDIDQLFLLEQPVDISEFNDFILISRQSSITPVFGKAYEELKEIISEKNEVLPYFEYSYSTPFPHQLVNRKNWMKLGLEYRNSFALEIQFRQCYVDYLLREIGDQKTIYMECPCYKGTNPATIVDNVIRINKKLLPVEVKLNIMLESNLEEQCEQYCKLDKLVLDKKNGRIAKTKDVVDDRVLIIDTYAVYMFFLKSKKIAFLYDLSDLQTKENLNELRRNVSDSLEE